MTEKEIWKAGNMLYPLPAVMVSTRGQDDKANILTVAWAGTVCTNPPMLSISVRPSRYSYQALIDNGEFVVNIPDESLAYATDYCGVKSGRDVDKFKDLKLTEGKCEQIKAPLITECPVNIECRVKERLVLGSHDMFVAEVLCVHADKKYMDEKGKFCFEKARPIVYSHGEYFGLGKTMGHFGYSVKKKKK